MVQIHFRAALALKRSPVTIRVTLRDIQLKFETAPGLFSPARIDPDTAFLLSTVSFGPGDKVLDLGCGYGIIGIFVAKLLGPGQVCMIDSDPDAVRCAVHNARENDVEGVRVELSDGFRQSRETAFTKILCNPPYHTDFSVAKHFIEKGFNRLVVGGSFWMVTHRDTWYRKKLTSVFGGVRVLTQDGYFVFQALKKREEYASRLSK